jgi:ATP-dependent Lhr-like helicase
MHKSAKQVQASSGLFYDVFRQYDPANMLLHQAQQEVLEQQLEQTRLAGALRRLQGSKIVITHPESPTPFAFPIFVDFLRQTMSTETMGDRIERMSARLELQAGTA